MHGGIVKAAALSEEPVVMGHYRDKDRIEVDFVLERSLGTTSAAAPFPANGSLISLHIVNNFPIRRTVSAKYCTSSSFSARPRMSRSLYDSHFLSTW